MKLLVFVAFSLFAAVYSQNDLPEFVSGIKVPERGGRAAITDFKTVCTGPADKNKLFCDDTDKCAAKTVVKCNGLGAPTNPLKKFQCEGTSTPYCDDSDTGGEAYCTSVRPESCKPPASTFECTGPGRFPDPSNCKIYYFCTEDIDTGNFDVQTIKCPNLYVFDPSQKGDNACRMTNNAFCTTVSCSGNDVNSLMSFQYFTKSMGQYIARCKTGGDIEVFRCDAGFEADLNTYPVKCKPICTGSSKLAYSGDDTKYWECINTGSKWEGFVWSCESGKHFDPKTKSCVLPTTG